MKIGIVSCFIIVTGVSLLKTGFTPFCLFLMWVMLLTSHIYMESAGTNYIYVQTYMYKYSGVFVKAIL